MSLGLLGAIGSGIGSVMSAFGAASNADALAAAYKKNIKDEKALYDRQSTNLEDLSSTKFENLYNLGGIFDRFESTGVFGDTDTLANLRQAQSDFSALAAGDFSGFESQLRKNMSDALIGTVGSGAPIGTYAGLAADTQMAFRQQGISTATGISEFLSQESNKLLGLEFGIMDQRFEVGYNLDRTKTSNIQNFRVGKAGTEGVGLMAAGNALTQIGGLTSNYSRYQDTLALQQQAQATRLNQLVANAPRAYPVYNPLSSTNGGGGGWSGGGSYMNDNAGPLPVYDNLTTYDYGNPFSLWGAAPRGSILTSSNDLVPISSNARFSGEGTMLPPW